MCQHSTACARPLQEPLTAQHGEEAAAGDEEVQTQGQEESEWEEEDSQSDSASESEGDPPSPHGDPQPGDPAPREEEETQLSGCSSEWETASEEETSADQGE